ncbi:MAG: sigma-70 family RNA polymerase sigma factor [bacterium]|nr:sigma-70 family RNA polymerase sigma factor [bacterium]
MLQPGSVTHWIQLLKDGDRASAQPLWERYHRRIVGLARTILKQSAHRHADEEDVAQEAFNSFFLAIQKGRLPNLADRNDLWRLLVVITKRKSIDQVRRSRRRSTGLEAEKLHSNSQRADTAVEPNLEEIVAEEPTPAMAAQLLEEYERLLLILDDQKLQEIAVWKLQAYTNEQIAQKLGCSRRTIIRKLETIRLIWEEDAGL